MGSKRTFLWRLALAATGLVEAAAMAAPAAPTAPATPSVAARAAQLPDPGKIALPEERTVLADMLAALPADPNADPAGALRAVDAALERLTLPTRLRGFLLFVRADLLMGMNRRSEAAEAVDRSISLLPEYGAPLALGFAVHVQADRPGVAADYLMRVSRVAPELIGRLDYSDVHDLLMRLDERGDRTRSEAVAARLLEVGWTGTDIITSSSLAMRAVSGRIAAGDLAGARALVPRLAAPQHALGLLVDLRFEAIWPDIEREAGARLERIWAAYLPALGERWRSSPDPEHAYFYARGLEIAGHNRTAIRELLPLFDTLDKKRDWRLMFVAPLLSTALGREGRWDELDAMFARALAVWPLGSDPAALNLAGNRALRHLYRGDAAAALAGMDAALADSARWPGLVTVGTLGQMHYGRACALHLLGKDDLAAASIAFVAAQRTRPRLIAELYTCLGRQDDARDTLIAALDDEALREDVLLFVQPYGRPPMRSPHSEEMRRRFEALAADPRLRAAVVKYGRILPFSMSDGAPPQQEPAD